MRRKPRARDESILAGGTGKYILRVGVLIAILTLVSYAWGYSSLGMQPSARPSALSTCWPPTCAISSTRPSSPGLGFGVA